MNKPDESQDVENRCNECRRYIGPTVTCPFCGHKNRRTSRITVTRNAALAIAVIGLLFLHIWSQSYGVPPMAIDDLDETSNYAMVEISGVIPRAPVYYPGIDGAPGTIYFTVDDGTQQVSVRAYPNPVVEEMLATGKIPAFGDRVNVSGNVYWYNAERGFILNSLDGLEIHRSEPVNMTIGEITDLDHDGMDGYYRVKTFGIVNSWRKYDFSLDISLIDERDNEISVYIPSSIYDLTGLGDLGTLEVGMGMEVIGCLEYYDAGSYSKWEIIPATTAELTRAQPDMAVTGLMVSQLTFPLNQQFNVTAIVINQGQLPVPSAILTIEFDGVTVLTQSVTNLGAGQLLEVTYSGAVTDLRTSIVITAKISVPEPHTDAVPSNDSISTQGGAR